jgi:hypothetical protein
VICLFRRLNTTWYEYMKTVNNLRVYDPRSLELKRLLNNLQNGEIIEASKKINQISFSRLIYSCLFR